ncbi:hypothetical protein BOTCAL_0156g00180 [Botryotinia calthae]|uniref:Cytochrome P450 n=1 Tax=Botryotinia calthae TaxID=38488 RepID=A0A4Y8D286_9HELO|nr:hypothetical protein BOTCAL_0156g00180 [Botryotinia calthae]
MGTHYDPTIRLHLCIVTFAIIDPLRYVPGPFLVRFTRAWYCWEIYKGHFERTNHQLHTRYGPIVRIAPNEYSIDDVDAAKVIYSIGGDTFPKARCDLDPHRHSANRRKVANYYSMSSMVGYECSVDNCTESLSRHFVESAISGNLIDMQHSLQCYAFDVIGEITFGQRFGFWIRERIGMVCLRQLMLEDRPGKITRNDLAATCQANVGAGSDTTAITLSSVLYHLLKHPHTYQNLRDEIEIAAKEGRVSDPITFKEAQGLPYLQAVIKEGLRVHSAVGGSIVGIIAYVAHKNTSVWGSDADQWRPERWLEIAEQGRGGEAEKYFFSFGMGSRTCIGKNISLLELSKLIPQLVRKFHFELDADVERNGGLYSLNRWFVKQQNFGARVLRRGKDGGME